jgi:hypothetical protein
MWGVGPTWPARYEPLKCTNPFVITNVSFWIDLNEKAKNRRPPRFGQASNDLTFLVLRVNLTAQIAGWDLHIFRSVICGVHNNQR